MKPPRLQAWHFAGLAIIAASSALLAEAPPKNKAGSAAPPAVPQLDASYGKLPLRFEANRGQTDPQVKFLARGSGYTLFLTDSDAVMVLRRHEPPSDPRRKATLPPATVSAEVPGASSPVALRMRLVGAKAAGTRVEGFEELPGKSNYFIGRDPAKWRTDVPTFAKVRYEQVWPGVDLVYYGNQGQLEYDFIVAPGVDPGQIALAFEGAEALRVDAKQGDLVMETSQGEVRWRKPLVYQEIDGDRREIACAYELREEAGEVGFDLAAYDATRPLVIDPVLVYSTFLGGTGGEGVSAIVLGPDNSAYLVGDTSSADFPTTPGAYNRAYVRSEGFVTRLNPAGTDVIFSTYIGGRDLEFFYDIAIIQTGKFAGDIFVVGVTQSDDFPTTDGAYQPASALSHIESGSQRGFVVRLNSDGSGLIYGTNLKGVGAYAVAVNDAGGAFVTGRARGGFLPTPGAFDETHEVRNQSDAFVARFNPAGSRLVYGTFLGGTLSDTSPGDGSDEGIDIALDANNNAYVVGRTSSSDFPTMPGPFSRIQGYYDAFVTKINPLGTGLVYSKIIAGSGSDGAVAIAVDKDDNASIAGWTDSPDFPVTARRAFQMVNGGSRDAWVARLKFDGLELLYCSYLGGSGDEYVRGLALGPTGAIHVAGLTESSDFPLKLPVQAGFAGGTTDAYVAAVNPFRSGWASLTFSTLLGGSDVDGHRIFLAGTVAVDSLSATYVAGFTRSSDFPTTDLAYQRAFQGSGEGFVTKLSAAISIDIQIQDPRINLSSSRVIQVEVFGSDTFDASSLDLKTVFFGVGGTEAAPVKTHFKDLNGDRRMDITFHFKSPEVGFLPGDTSGTLSGWTFKGVQVIGSDVIETVGKPHKGKTPPTPQEPPGN